MVKLTLDAQRRIERILRETLKGAEVIASFVSVGALRGANLQEGEAGIGPTPKEALDCLLELDVRNKEYQTIKGLLSNPMDCKLGAAACGSCDFLLGKDCTRNKIREVIFGGL